MRARSAVTADTVRKCGASFSCRRFPAAGMGVVVWLVYRLFLYLLRSNLIATLVSIVAGVFTYATLLLMLKGTDRAGNPALPERQNACKTPRGRCIFALIE